MSNPVVKETLDKYYQNKYNMNHEEFMAEYGEADFAHDESLVIHTMNEIWGKIHSVLKQKKK